MNEKFFSNSKASIEVIKDDFNIPMKVKFSIIKIKVIISKGYSKSLYLSYLFILLTLSILEIEECKNFVTKNTILMLPKIPHL